MAGAIIAGGSTFEYKLRKSSQHQPKFDRNKFITKREHCLAVGADVALNCSTVGVDITIVFNILRVLRLKSRSIDLFSW